jgi:hypothetical protein
MPFFEPTSRIVATIGYPGHGKTVFLAGLFWDSFFTLSESFHDDHQPYSVHAITEEASKVFFGNARALNRLELPPPNPRTTPEPAVLEFKGIPCVKPRWWRNDRQNIQLTFYDIAGEHVTSDAWLRENAPFLPDADDIIFIFDPIRDDFTESVLLASELRDRIFRVAPNSHNKHFIVALSKMDELGTRDDWWAEVLLNRWADVQPTSSSLPDYFDRMDELSNSELLRSWWTNEARQAHKFIKSLPEGTRFCALSSLGHQPVWNCRQCQIMNPGSETACVHCAGPRGNVSLRLARKPDPFRVRDPLFWIFRAAGVM